MTGGKKICWMFFTACLWPTKNLKNAIILNPLCLALITWFVRTGNSTKFSSSIDGFFLWNMWHIYCLGRTDARQKYFCNTAWGVTLVQFCSLLCCWKRVRTTQIMWYYGCHGCQWTRYLQKWLYLNSVENCLCSGPSNLPFISGLVTGRRNELYVWEVSRLEIYLWFPFFASCHLGLNRSIGSCHIVFACT